MKLFKKIFSLEMDSMMFMLFVFFLISSNFRDGIESIFYYALSTLSLLMAMSTYAIVKAIKENKEEK